MSKEKPTQPKKKGIQSSEQESVASSDISKKKQQEKKQQEKKKVKTQKAVTEEVKISTIDQTLKSARSLTKTDRRIDTGIPKPIFKHARDKDKKCFALGGVMTDVINSLKGQTYALAGTGFYPDGTPIVRAKGTNWEELYTELLTYMATSEGLGCTYQGDFSRLKSFKSTTDASQSLLDDLSTDLRKMTLHRSAFGPRYSKKVAEIDSDIKDIALRAQLANMQWDYLNMDRVIQNKERYAELSPEQRAIVDALAERVRTVKDKSQQQSIIDGTSDVTQVDSNGNPETIKKFNAIERKKFFFPPTEKDLDDLKTLTGIREKEASAIDDKVTDRKAILSSTRPSRFSMREAADKVVAGLDKVSEEIFGDMQEEKEAARAMLADAIGLYANDAQLFVSLENRTPSEASKALHGHEREEFAKILEILGRLRLAREFSEKDTVESLKKEMILESSVKQNRERDVLETLTSDIAKQASSEQFKTTFESTLTELMRRATRATDEKETEKVVKQLRTYGTMHDALYPKSKAPVEDLVPIKQTVKEEPLREPKDVEKTPPKPRRGRTATRRMT